uniref:CSON007493 protein n=1 Tax=Culicoides sonorensis TaxID=179676 RepID=A0A336LY94_CULSO
MLGSYPTFDRAYKIKHTRTHCFAPNYFEFVEQKIERSKNPRYTIFRLFCSFLVLNVDKYNDIPAKFYNHKILEYGLNIQGTILLIHCKIEPTIELITLILLYEENEDTKKKNTGNYS